MLDQIVQSVSRVLRAESREQQRLRMMLEYTAQQVRSAYGGSDKWLCATDRKKEGFAHSFDQYIFAQDCTEQKSESPICPSADNCFLRASKSDESMGWRQPFILQGPIPIYCPSMKPEEKESGADPVSVPFDTSMMAWLKEDDIMKTLPATQVLNTTS